MKLNSKINLFFIALATVTIGILLAVSLLSFRHFSIQSTEAHIRTSAEIVRVSLTEAMINGMIGKRAQFLTRLAEVQGLKTARVIRGPMVEHQFGKGLDQEQPADEAEQQVLKGGQPFYQLTESNGETIFRGTIPFVATNTGSPNCLQCHQVPQGTVLGAVTLTMSISELRNNALLTIGFVVGAVALSILVAMLFLRRLLKPLSVTANDVENAVQRAIHGDFRANIARTTNDEIGQIAEDINRLMAFLHDGLSTIGNNVAQLIKHAPPAGYNLLITTVEMVEGLIKAAHFKLAIEEDETRAEIYQRLSDLMRDDFSFSRFSIYEVGNNNNQMTPVIVDGEVNGACRWCDPEILMRSESCRARRTGHLINSVETPDICYSFRPPVELGKMSHICIPIIQSGTVGSILQIVSSEDEKNLLQMYIPFINIYLRETAPVLEAKRLMDTLRESNLRDAMTGLRNRRFLEEYVETLVASSNRRKNHLSILMLDLDYFKMVNDNHGHDAGDTVLKALSRVLAQSVRASDLVIRYGGEEFLIILQDSADETADTVAEKIRASVEALKIQVGGTTLQKTISIGISDFPKDSETFWQAVKYADVALYRAKEEGRNRVVRFDKAMWAADNKEIY
jgi:diguanylate cyclase (GGDEF)-like protein